MEARTNSMSQLSLFPYSVPLTDQIAERHLAPIICIRDCYPAVWSRGENCYVQGDNTMMENLMVKSGDVISEYESFEANPYIWRIQFMNLPIKYFKKNFITLEDFRNNKIDQIL